MKKLIFFLAVPLMAQYSGNTVLKQVFNAVTATGPSNPIPTLGQSFHIIQTTALNNGGNVCSGFTGRIQMEGGYDGVNWTRIGQPINNILASTPILNWAYGAFPWIRVNYISGDTTNCTLTVWYSGSTTGARINAVFDSTVKNGFTNGSTGTTGSTDVSVVACGNFTQNMTVYGFLISNPTGGDITGVKWKIIDSQPVTIDEFDVGTIKTGTNPVSVIAPGSIPIIGQNQGLANISSPPVTLHLQASASGLIYWALVRCE